MTDYLKIARFPLPDDWQPEGTVCVNLNIPNDPQYLETLSGLVDALMQSSSFDRDPTRTGAATVARTWKAALLSAPIEMGCDMAFQLRQNPDDPCQLQQSFDGGLTWSLAFDYLLCNGSSVINQPAPYVGSSSGNEDAAAAVVWNVQQKLASIADAHCAGSKDAAVQEMLSWLRMFEAGYSGTGNLGAIYDAYCALSAPEQAAFLGDDQYCGEFTELSQCANVDGLFDALDCLNEIIVDWLNTTNVELMDLLNKAAAFLGANGIQSAAAYGTAGAGAGFGSGNCAEWYRVYKFDDSAWPDAEEWNHGWTTVNSPGVFVPGQGWRYLDYYYSPFNAYGRVLSMGIRANGMNLLKYRVRTVTNTIEGFPGGMGGVRQNIDPGGDLHTAGVTTPGEFIYDHTWTGNVTTDVAKIYVPINGDNDGSLTGNGYVKIIELWGKGNAPVGGTP